MMAAAVRRGAATVKADANKPTKVLSEQGMIYASFEGDVRRLVIGVSAQSRML